MPDRFSAALSDTGRCVVCGLCVPACPTYRKTLLEADSPRGRIALVRGVLEGRLAPTERFARHVDLCLGCRSCEAVCPNQVKYSRIIDSARFLVEGNRHRDVLSRTLKRLSLFMVAHPRQIERLARFYRGGIRNQAQKLLGGTRIGKLEKRLPAQIGDAPASTIYPAKSAPRGEVGLFLGCVARALDSVTPNAAIHVLNELGYTVHVPRNQGCCGAIHRNGGKAPGKLQRQNLDAFSGLDLCAIVATASGCGAELFEYPEPFQAKIVDICEFLATSAGWEHLEIRPLPKKIAVHEPCSLKNVLRAEQYPYQLLRKIPQVQIAPLSGNDQCCGGAGSYFLREPEMANLLAGDKMQAWQEAGADYLATSNIGCALAMQTGIDSAKILHPVAILAYQMGFEKK